ncbi:hypothetical protein AYL99_02374 [Fonsecaea erecta]|uniref:Uncharacterized protein n=1 Tax=Fonsecaea erecta TaxID=1367422 RepID=A0A178ZTP1_9EURO|nr:hypothetical protein AYL99_02374 [Fonsecaea erecta]OAP63147.1 hypothetical protein AYL99_02374 [Fonsecaea erecta]
MDHAKSKQVSSPTTLRFPPRNSFRSLLTTNFPIPGTALSFTWPQCLPADLDTVVTPFRAAWMQLVMACPLVRHTFIFAPTKQMLCLRGSPDNDNEADMSRPAVPALPVHRCKALNHASAAIEAVVA